MGLHGRLPDAEVVYRGMRNANWCKHGVVKYKAFLLRPGEGALSLGRSPQTAVNDLGENHGAALLSCEQVHALPHNLEVIGEVNGGMKAQMLGVPPYSDDPDLRDRAMTVATDLAGISTHVPIPPVNQAD